jgi:pimeloyl-ACP methyl ester carboxylesterase
MQKAIASAGIAILFSSFALGLRLDCLFWRPAQTEPSNARQGELWKNPDYFEEEIVFENRTSRLRLAGTLTKPYHGGPFPAVLLICGSGPVHRENSYGITGMFSLIADRMTRKGFAVFRYDKRGVGGSEGTFADATLVEFADDACAGFNYLRALDGVDVNSVGVLGHSEGGIVASIVASRSQDVAFAILMGSPGQTAELRDYQWLASETKRLRYNAEAIKEIFESQRVLHELIKSGKTDADTVARARRAIAGAMTVENMDKEVKKQLSTPYRFLLTFDPAKPLRGIHCPVLVLAGEKDRLVEPKYELPVLEDALKANRDVTIKQLPDLNHCFQKCTTGSLEEMALLKELINPAALDVIETWASERTSRCWDRVGR